MLNIEELKLSRTPWEHQGATWEKTEDVSEHLARWDMGTGKTTFGTVWLRIKYRKAGRVLKTLILSPLATLSGWKKDFLLNSPPQTHDHLVIAAGTGKKKMPGAKRAELILKPESAIVVTNHESLILPAVVDAMKKKQFEAILIDEIHRFKNPKSKRFKNLITFSDKAQFRLGLTGTLILNSYMDVWAPARFLDKGKRFNTNFFSFRNTYFTDLNAGMAGMRNYFPDWQPKPACAREVADKLASLMSDCKKENCLSLPPRVVTQIEVDMGPEQQRLYDSMADELVAEVERGEATASNALVKLLRMRQIMAGFMPIEGTPENPEPQRVHYFEENPRLDALKDIIEDLCDAAKLVVWSNFRAMYPKLRSLCEELGFGYAELTGDTKDRDGEIKRFQEDDKCRVFLANPQAGGTGVDGLQKVASYCAYFDRSHNLEHYLQSRDRIHRGGSEVHQRITEMHLVAQNTIDVDILQALERKESFADIVLERVRLRHGREAISSEGRAR